MKNKLNINNTPLYKILKGYKNRYRFHMPGHKGGSLIKKYFGSRLFDITELPFSGNLFDEEGIIQEAEKLYAACYNAKAVKFSSAGSTVGIISAVYSLKELGKSLIIEKNSHKSVYSALKISGIEPIIINNILQKNDLYSHITSQEVEKSMEENPDCIGALITSPDYYGFFADIEGIAHILHKRKKLLIIDASHGAHLPFYYKDLYKSADIYICSAHKTLPSFTPASFTVFNNVDYLGGYKKSFDIFHTSSPSYTVLSSMDIAREYMVRYGELRLCELNNLYKKYSSLFKRIGFEVVCSDDFTKLIIGKDGCSGYTLYNFLVAKGLYCEFYDENYVLALFTVCDGEKSYKRLYKALKNFKYEKAESKNQKLFFNTERKMPYLKAYNAEKELVPLNKGAGRIAACDVGLFPPSYPIICCGEMLTQELCKYLEKEKERSFGLDNNGIYVVK